MNYISRTSFDNYAEIAIITTRFDSNVSPILKSELTKIFNEKASHLLIDLSISKYCDSTGISALLMAQRLCNQHNKSLIMYGVNDIINSIFKVSKLNSVFKIVNNKTEALQLLN